MTSHVTQGMENLSICRLLEELDCSFVMNFEVQNTSKSPLAYSARYFRQETALTCPWNGRMKRRQALPVKFTRDRLSAMEITRLRLVISKSRRFGNVMTQFIINKRTDA